MTTINNNFKSKVFKAAWTSIRNGKSENLSQALKSAWAWAKRTLVDLGVEIHNIIKETEKAICCRVHVEELLSEQEISRNIWIPKSMISNNTIPTWLWNKKVEEVLESVNRISNSIVVSF